MAVWTVKAGRHGEREERCLDHGVAGGGWEQISDLTQIESKDALNDLCAREAPGWAAKTRSNYVAQLWSLRERMQQNELVVLPLKTTGLWRSGAFPVRISIARTSGKSSVTCDRSTG